MSTNFEQGQTLGRGDLDVFLTDASGNPTNAYEISYALYFVDPSTGAETLIGPRVKIPVNPEVGEYYAAMRIPTGAEIGCYRIRWVFRQTSTSPQEGAVQQFGVIGPQQVTVDPYSPCVRDLINKMRVLTRDNSPSRNYRFMPPQGEGVVGCYNQVFGYIWEDAEFAEYLEMALWKWNMQAPNTDSSYPTVESICQNKKSWQAALLWGSLVTAAQALVYNWIQQEFSVAGKTLVRVHLPSGREVSLPIEELYEICKGEELNFGGSLREAFLGGNLKTLSVDPGTGKVGLHVIQDIMKHHTGDRASVTCQTEDGRSVTTTCDHSLFRTEGIGVSPVKAEDLRSGDLVSQVLGGVLGEVQVSVSLGEPLQVSYDLCVPGPENFVLSNGILAHNSYSIGGISLDIERSSKYESMKQNAEEQWDKLVEMKARTSKYLRGLQQPRFGRGVRSAFGPYVGRGILSPRNFLIFMLYFTGEAYYRHVEAALHAHTLSSLLS